MTKPTTLQLIPRANDALNDLTLEELEHIGKIAIEG